MLKQGVFEIINEKNSSLSILKPALQKFASQNNKGDIEFNHVWFKYPHSDWKLKDFSSKITLGEVNAFVGISPSGHHAILDLLYRFYSFQSGEILIDGHRIEEYDVSSLRKSYQIISPSSFSNMPNLLHTRLTDIKETRQESLLSHSIRLSMSD